MTPRAVKCELAGAATLGLIVGVIADGWLGSPLTGALVGLGLACAFASVTWQDWKENPDDHYDSRGRMQR